MTVNVIHLVHTGDVLLNSILDWSFTLFGLMFIIGFVPAMCIKLISRS